MRCPKCGTEMRAVDFAELAGDRVLTTVECPGCHYRMQQEQVLKKPSVGREQLH